MLSMRLKTMLCFRMLLKRMTNCYLLLLLSMLLRTMLCFRNDDGMLGATVHHECREAVTYVVEKSFFLGGHLNTQGRAHNGLCSRVTHSVQSPVTRSFKLRYDPGLQLRKRIALRVPRFAWIIQLDKIFNTTSQSMTPTQLSAHDQNLAIKNWSTGEIAHTRLEGAPLSLSLS